MVSVICKDGIFVFFCCLLLAGDQFQVDLISFNTTISACSWSWALQLLQSAGNVAANIHKTAVLFPRVGKFLESVMTVTIYNIFTVYIITYNYSIYIIYTFIVHSCSECFFCSSGHWLF